MEKLHRNSGNLENDKIYTSKNGNSNLYYTKKRSPPMSKTPPKFTYKYIMNGDYHKDFVTKYK